MEYNLQDIASILNSKVPAYAKEIIIDTLLTDSRKLISPQTSLFFALKSPRRNGHLFIPDLYKKGIKAFVISQDVNQQAYPGAVFFKVPDTLIALQKLASAHRSHFNYTVIGITGSNGKTVVKEWLYQLLQQDSNIVRSPKSYNSQIGVPLSVWQMTAQHNLGIFEAGISQPGEMGQLHNIIQPTIGILTNIGTAHSEGFEDREQKLQEKLKLFTQAAVIIANGDEGVIKTNIEKLPVLFFSWGWEGSNNVQVLHVNKSPLHTAITLKYDDDSFTFEIPFTDNAAVENAITCAALLLYLKTGPAIIQQRMKLLHAVSMRLEYKQGINNCLIINDSYSADYQSLSIALDFLKQQAIGRKKTVILSDFLEVKKNDAAFYNQILRQLQQYGVNRLIGIGEKMLSILSKVTDINKTGIEARFYISTQNFREQFHSTDFKDEAILVKGARVFELEDIVALLEQKVHQTVLEINLDHIVHNLNYIQKKLQPAVKIMAMVKAFAYGSGAAEIASVLQFNKVDYLGVAYADEGVELRKAGITMPIMVLNVEEYAFDIITAYRLEPDIYSFALLAAFEDHVKEEGLQQYPVHIEVETGMNRLGFSIDDIPELGTRLKNNSFIKIQSVFSHLVASEDALEDAFSFHQYELLLKAIQELKGIISYPFLRHIANSSAIVRFPQMQLDMVRLGIGLYGVAGNDKQLLPVATLKSTIAQIKKVHKGETVSYNRKGVAQQESVIATIRIGYADGYSRRLGYGNGKMYVKGQLAPVIGTVCMDMTMIDVTHIDGVAEGDEVIVFGEQLPIQQVASWMGTIPYEIMTSISQRVKRVYFGEG